MSATHIENIFFPADSEELSGIIIKNEKAAIPSLILFAPAIYDKRAYGIPFTKRFSDMIKEKRSWENSDIFSILEKFKGNLLIFIGEKDEVIPNKVIQLLDQHSPHAANKEIVVLPGAGHAIHTWIQEKPNLADEVAKKIVEFL